MQRPSDTYRTLNREAEGLSKERGSKFLAYAYPVQNEAQIRGYLEALRKRHYNATHHCFAWRLGPRGEHFRANDDGEPSSTAGKPILGQLLSRELTDTLVVVVRYFGGKKLGVSGLIAAYKEAAAEVLDLAEIVEQTAHEELLIEFEYPALNNVMRVIKEMEPQIMTQDLDNLCRVRLQIRISQLEALRKKLLRLEGVSVVEIQQK